MPTGNLRHRLHLGVWGSKEERKNCGEARGNGGRPRIRVQPLKNSLPIHLKHENKWQPRSFLGVDQEPASHILINPNPPYPSHPTLQIPLPNYRAS